MATENLSAHGKQNTFVLKGLYCSTDIAAGIHIQLKCVVILNIFLSITAFLENSLILFALHKELSSLHPPSKLLLRNLAITDLCVGLFVDPLYVTLLLTAQNEHWSSCRSLEVAVSMLSTILCAVSLLTLTAISVDRLLALLLGLRYRQVVTLKRVYLISIVFYIVSTASAIIKVFWNSLIASWYDILCVSLCLVVSTFCYTKIFFTLRHHQHQVQDHIQQPNHTNQLNIARYRKAVSTALWLEVTLIACYLPYSILITLLIHAEPSSSVALAWSYTVTLLYLNSSLNPILYCWKLDEVRQAVKDTIRQLLCCSSS